MREERVKMAGREEMFLIVSVLLPIAIDLMLRSETQGGVEVLEGKTAQRIGM